MLPGVARGAGDGAGCVQGGNMGTGCQEQVAEEVLKLELEPQQ